ncbi:rhodanese family protein [Tepidamorphus sp. 3E244]|uniref:rhodanese family protein n=1 Tax=Tepidamorphus sp. 3E244 TaxID=3385498 RepID=UPI0038FC212C
MTPTTITPQQARKLIGDGAKLVDIREADEYAREHIPGAKLVSLSRISAGTADTGNSETVIYHCRSGGRTMAAIDHLRPLGHTNAYILEGGLEAWKKAGFETKVDKSRPIDLMRQVQIAAGSLVLLGVVLGFLLHPAFFGISAFVGAGLTFAGVTGFCGMARMLAVMPWNRRSEPAGGTPQEA